MSLYVMRLCGSTLPYEIYIILEILIVFGAASVTDGSILEILLQIVAHILFVISWTILNTMLHRINP